MVRLPFRDAGEAQPSPQVSDFHPLRRLGATGGGADQCGARFTCAWVERCWGVGFSRRMTVRVPSPGGMQRSSASVPGPPADAKARPIVLAPGRMNGAISPLALLSKVATAA